MINDQSLIEKKPGAVEDREQIPFPDKDSNYIDYLKEKKPEYLEALNIVADFSKQLKNNAPNSFNMLIGSPAYQMASGSRIKTPNDIDFVFVHSSQAEEVAKNFINKIKENPDSNEVKIEFLEDTDTYLYSFVYKGIQIDLFGQPQDASTEKVFLNISNLEEQEKFTNDLQTLKLDEIGLPVAGQSAVAELYIKNLFKELGQLVIDGKQDEEEGVYDSFKFADRIVKLLRVLPKETVDYFFSQEFKIKEFLNKISSYTNNKIPFDYSLRSLALIKNEIEKARQGFLDKGNIAIADEFQALGEETLSDLFEGVRRTKEESLDLDKMEKMTSEVRKIIKEVKKELTIIGNEIKKQDIDSLISDVVSDNANIVEIKNEFNKFIAEKSKTGIRSCFIPPEGGGIHREINDDCKTQMNNILPNTNVLAGLKIDQAKHKINELKKRIDVLGDQFYTAISVFKNIEKKDKDYASYFLINKFEDYLNDYENKILAQVLLVRFFEERVNKESVNNRRQALESMYV